MNEAWSRFGSRKQQLQPRTTPDASLQLLVWQHPKSTTNDSQGGLFEIVPKSSKISYSDYVIPRTSRASATQLDSRSPRHTNTLQCVFNVPRRADSRQSSGQVASCKQLRGSTSQAQQAASTKEGGLYRQESFVSQSSSHYDSVTSWTSPPPTLSSHSNFRPVSGLNSLAVPLQRGDNRALPKPVIPCLSTRCGKTLLEVGHHRWGGTRSRRKAQQEMEEKIELQNILGRPSDSSDSHYAICSRFRIAESCSPILSSPSPLGEAHFSPLRLDLAQRTGVSSHPGVPAHQSPNILGTSPLNYSKRASSFNRHRRESGDSKSESTDSGFTMSSMTLSMGSSEDEARKLWKKLESSLGTELGCRSLRRVVPSMKAKLVTASRIPRPKPGTYLSKKLPVDSVNNCTQISACCPKRQSRIPVPVKIAKVDWEPKLKRSSSIVSQTLLALRSGTCLLRSDSVSRRSVASIAYIGALPLAEKNRREEAIRQRMWGEQSLRIVS